MGRKAKTKDYKENIKEEPIYWWIVPISIMLAIFVFVDGNSVYDIFYLTK